MIVLTGRDAVEVAELAIRILREYKSLKGI